MDSKGSGIKLLKDAYRLHINDPEVVENICMLINEMVQYGEVMVVLDESLPLPQKIVKKTNSSCSGMLVALRKNLRICERRMNWN